MTRFPVQFPTKEYMIGGKPLASEEKMARMFPELVAAQKVVNDTPEGKETNDMIEELIFQIVRLFNGDIEKEFFMYDKYSSKETFNIWNGLHGEPQKKS